jgi:hypothetical protein
VAPRESSGAPGGQRVEVVPAARAARPVAIVGTPTAGTRLRQDRSVVGLAFLAAVTAWLPWLRSPRTSMFELTGGTGIAPVLNAWDLPARSLWSDRGSAGGIELGWFVVGFAVLMVVACVRGASVGTVRSLAGLEAAVALLFVFQTYRRVDAVPGAVAAHVGTLDFLGVGPLALLVLAIGLVLVPRR